MSVGPDHMPSMAILAHLTDRAVIAVTGAGARPFLNNLLTQNVETLADGELRYAALLTPQGRLLHDLFLFGEGEEVLLDVSADTADVLLVRLKMYRLRAKVELARTEGAIWAKWDLDPPPSGTDGGGGQPNAGEGAAAAPHWVIDPRTPAMGWRTLTPAPASAPSTASWSPSLAGGGGGGSDAYDRHRLVQGVPDVHRDGLSDRAYPLEADLDLLNAIDFKKGCFVGQETTSRMHRRGVVKTRLLPLIVDAAAPGAEVLAGSLRAGEVTYAREGRALALLRLDRIASADLTVNGRPARVDPPAWFPALPATAPVAPAS